MSRGKYQKTQVASGGSFGRIANCATLRIFRWLAATFFWRATRWAASTTISRQAKTATANYCATMKEQGFKLKEWFAVGLSLAAFALSLVSVYITDLRVTDDVRVVAELLFVFTDFKKKQFTIQEINNRFTFINIGTRSIHSQLHPGRNGDQRVDSREFIGSLCTALQKTAAGTAHLRFEHLGIGVALPLAQAVGVGLIINELVTNSAKYAFPGEREGWITVTLTVHGDECQVCVADNGVGKGTKAKGSGRGLGLAEGLAQQLGGSFSLESSTEGTQGKIRFRIKGKQIEVDNRGLACV